MTNYSLNFVIKLALILLLSTLPSLAYLLIFRRAKERWQMRLRHAQILTTYQPQIRTRYSLEYEESYFPDRTAKYFIGDVTCINNAKSPYIRCAINPSGPCAECSHYENSYQN